MPCLGFSAAPSGDAVGSERCDEGHGHPPRSRQPADRVPLPAQVPSRVQARLPTGPTCSGATAACLQTAAPTAREPAPLDTRARPRPRAIWAAGPSSPPPLAVRRDPLHRQRMRQRQDSSNAGDRSAQGARPTGRTEAIRT
jgi:hypothetical protein